MASLERRSEETELPGEICTYTKVGRSLILRGLSFFSRLRVLRLCVRAGVFRLHWRHVYLIWGHLCMAFRAVVYRFG